MKKKRSFKIQTNAIVFVFCKKNACRQTPWIFSRNPTGFPKVWPKPRPTLGSIILTNTFDGNHQVSTWKCGQNGWVVRGLRWGLVRVLWVELWLVLFCCLLIVGSLSLVGCLVACLLAGWLACCRLTVKTPQDFQSKADVPNRAFPLKVTLWQCNKTS